MCGLFATDGVFFPIMSSIFVFFFNSNEFCSNVNGISHVKTLFSFYFFVTTLFMSIFQNNVSSFHPYLML